MTHPIANARLRPIIAPTLAPVIISAAITSVYAVIAVWIPVTVVPTSLATVAIDTFITELSSVMRNCADASVMSTVPEADADRLAVAVTTSSLGRACLRCLRRPVRALGVPDIVSARPRRDLITSQRGYACLVRLDPFQPVPKMMAA